MTRILNADCIEAMAEMEAESVDAIVCDPPYGIEFMGRDWDRFRTDDPGTTRHRGERAGVHGELKGENKTNPAAGTVAYGGGKRPGTYRCTGCGKRDQFRNDHDCAPDARWARELIDPHSAPPTMLAFQNWCRTWGLAAYRVLKPGGHLLAFGGTRTYHRLTSGLEDAGFEIRDSLIWLYGSGFPKSLDVSKAIDKAAGVEREVERMATRSGNAERRGEGDQGATFGDSHGGFTTVSDPITPEAQRWQGWGTALKPAHEPIVVARKPLAGTVAATVCEHGTGALNIDGSRIAMSDEDREAARVPQPLDGTGAIYGFAHGTGRNGQTFEPPDAGRWPANIILSESAAAALDEQSGELASPAPYTRTAGVQGMYGPAKDEGWEQMGYGDTGGASRFFFVARAEAGTMAPCQSIAPDATSHSPADEPPIGTAPSDAQTSLSPGATRSSDSTELTTSATPSESDESAASDMPTTPSTGPRSSRKSQPARRTPTASPASDAEPSEPTDTTTTTPSRSRSAGSAEAATSSTTPSNTAPGAKDSSLPIDEPGARFRYCAKASASERNAGLRGFPDQVVQSGMAGDMPVDDRGADRDRFKTTQRNVHPTVKPLALMRWLVRLVTPPDGTVLDPFTGSGTTGAAAALEGFDFIGIEREAEYAAIAEARIKFWAQFPGADVDAVLASDARAREIEDAGQLGLLALLEEEAEAA